MNLQIEQLLLQLADFLGLSDCETRTVIFLSSDFQIAVEFVLLYTFIFIKFYHPCFECCQAYHIKVTFVPQIFNMLFQA